MHSTWSAWQSQWQPQGPISGPTEWTTATQTLSLSLSPIICQKRAPPDLRPLAMLCNLLVVVNGQVDCKLLTRRAARFTPNHRWCLLPELWGKCLCSRNRERQLTQGAARQAIECTRGAFLSTCLPLAGAYRMSGLDRQHTLVVAGVCGQVKGTNPLLGHWWHWARALLTSIMCSKQIHNLVVIEVLPLSSHSRNSAQTTYFSLFHQVFDILLQREEICFV